MAIQPDGLYYFETEMPGDESANGWGPDPEPHIHFDIVCTGCAGDHPVVAGDYQYWNKFYPETLCTIAGCGTQVRALLDSPCMIGSASTLCTMPLSLVDQYRLISCIQIQLMSVRMLAEG